MSDRGTWSDPSLDAALEAALADLAGALRFPATPPLAAAVGAAVRLEPAPGRWAWPMPLRRSMVLALAALVLVVGVAGAIGLGTGAIRIRFADGTPLPSVVGSDRGFGTEMTLEQAQANVSFSIRPPDVEGLPPPDHVFVADVPTGGTVTLAWGDLPGYPAGADGLGLVITEFRADISPDVFNKMVADGTTVVRTVVSGVPAWWVEGGSHYFFYVDAEGQLVDETIRLVGNVLFWEEEGLTFRIEGAPDLRAAIRVAESIPPASP